MDEMEVVTVIKMKELHKIVETAKITEFKFKTIFVNSK